MGDLCLIPGLGRSPEGRHGNPLQYSCLENPTGRGPWRLQSTGLQWVRHNWSDLACMHSFTLKYLFQIGPFQQLWENWNERPQNPWNFCSCGTWSVLHGRWMNSRSGCFLVVQSFSHVWLFATPWTAALQASLSFTISWNLLKLMSIELVMPSNHLGLCHPLQSFPASGSFLMSRLFTSGGRSIGTSASASFGCFLRFTISL